MIIANPIYDVVFKRMMENEKVAKFFISTFLQQPVESVEFRPQEFTYSDDHKGIAVFKLDFVATIKTPSGEARKVLIEIQKAKNHTDILRFRNYLGEQYKKEDVVNNQKTILPITTIYILGFKIPEIETACMQVGRRYHDMIHNRVLETKSDFVEKLTHDCYVVQVDRITDEYQSDLQKLLSVFGQTNFVDDTKITKQFNHIADIEEVKIMTDILHYSGTDPEEKKKIETEKEAWRTFYAALEEESKELIKELNEKKQELNDAKKDLNEKEKALEEKEKALREKDDALREKDRIIAELMGKKDAKDYTNPN